MNSALIAQMAASAAIGDLDDITFDDFNKKLASLTKVSKNKIARPAINTDAVRTFVSFDTTPIQEFDFNKAVEKVNNKQIAEIDYCFTYLRRVAEVKELNKLTEWTNQYLVQLIHAVGSRHIAQLEVLYEKNKDNKKAVGKNNIILNLIAAYKKLLFERSLYALNSPEGKDGTISLEGNSYLKEFFKLAMRYEKINRE